jgi:hypothetical protein
MGTVVAAVGLIALGFQNCGRAKFAVKSDGSSVDLASPCGTVSCSLAPLTTKPAVTTILLALGDEDSSALVGNSVSNQFLAESVIRFSSPVQNPKILIVRAKDNAGEDPEDTAYIETLLSRYQTTVIDEPAAGLTTADVQGYDLIWFNNPGHPFSIKVSYDTLLAFDGGVVLQGDDLARSASFSMTPLTGLTYIDNGASVRCNGVDYPHDNNGGEQFRVSLDPARIQGIDASSISFRYGNDIDNTTVANPDVEVIAVAQGGPASCTDTRPAVVTLKKN